MAFGWLASLKIGKTLLLPDDAAGLWVDMMPPTPKLEGTLASPHYFNGTIWLPGSGPVNGLLTSPAYTTAANSSTDKMLTLAELQKMMDQLSGYKAADSPSLPADIEQKFVGSFDLTASWLNFNVTQLYYGKSPIATAIDDWSKFHEFYRPTLSWGGILPPSADLKLFQEGCKACARISMLRLHPRRLVHSAEESAGIELLKRDGQWPPATSSV